MRLASRTIQVAGVDLVALAPSTGLLRLHRARKKSDGSLSIGISSGLLGLREIRVTQVGPRSSRSLQITELTTVPVRQLRFILILNRFRYHFEAAVPISDLAAFLMLLAGCWRTYIQASELDMISHVALGS